MCMEIAGPLLAKIYDALSQDIALSDREIGRKELNIDWQAARQQLCCQTPEQLEKSKPESISFEVVS